MGDSVDDDVAGAALVGMIPVLIDRSGAGGQTVQLDFHNDNDHRSKIPDVDNVQIISSLDALRFPNP